MLDRANRADQAACDNALQTWDGYPSFRDVAVLRVRNELQAWMQTAEQSFQRVPPLDCAAADKLLSRQLNKVDRRELRGSLTASAMNFRASVRRRWRARKSARPFSSSMMISAIAIRTRVMLLAVGETSNSRS